MAIISEIGRKSPRVRGLIISIYIVLTLGALSMIYPFMIMIAGSTKSQVDLKEFKPIPAFLIREDALYRKHIEGLFNESLDQMNIAFQDDVSSFEVLMPPENPNAKFAQAWHDFLTETDLPDYTFGLGYVQTPLSKSQPLVLRQIKKTLMDRFGNKIDAMNAEFGTEFVGWNSLYILPENYLLRRNKPLSSPFADAYRDFKIAQPEDLRFYFSVEGFYKRLYLKPQYSKDIAEYNRLHKTDYASYEQIHLTRHYPKEAPEKAREDWENFVRNTLNLLWIRVEESGLQEYRAFLESKYRKISVLNKNYKSNYTAFTEIPLFEVPPMEGIPLSDWEFFIAGWKDPDSERLFIAPLESLRVHSIDFMLRDFLIEKYESIDGVNSALGTNHADVMDILPPQQDFLYFAFKEDVGFLRWEFMSRNYKAVLDYMVFHGRGIINTVIYCALAIALALLVNPLAAYAMSRYRMPSTYKILLFLLLTMAFPPMVTQIPVFLMLRELGLLNTFAALVLPGMANGYSIFLLKGFFDSLPQELYESASLDGASEWTMFWQITMTLSKPILAVIALNTFTMAYSNFMFALLICQDEKMWTLMVWLYQLQNRSGQGVLYASLILAALPTLLVFIFCQNIIMRGIVVPVEK